MTRFMDFHGRSGAGLASLALVVGLGLLTGCRGNPTADTPIVPIRNMYDQPRYNAQGVGAFFKDDRALRHLVPGTIAKEMEIERPIATGRVEDNSTWVLEVPPAVVQRHGGMERLVNRGQNRFNIYCAPCHGYTGHGDGMVARRAQRLGAAVLKPPSFHIDRIRHMPDGQMFATITHGIRNMPAYGINVPVDDRWAIITYVRALELSQAAQRTAMNTEVTQ